MSQIDAIGVMRKHRWAPLSAQRIRLEDDGCRVVVDLDDTPRRWLYEKAIRTGTIIKAAYAFLLVEKRGLVAGVADFKAFADKIAKLPRGCHGYVKDLDTGLIGDTPGARKAMLDVVRGQLMRSNRGLAASESAKRGPKAVVLTDLQTAKAEAIWRNVRRWPTWEDVEQALQEQVHEDFTRWRGHRMFGPRQTKR